VYQNGDSLFAVTVDPTSGATGRPSLLFAGSFQTRVPAWTYDVTPDGNRFLMMKVPPGSEPRQVEVVLNWFEELKKNGRP
jgi:hypothetical protein